MSNKLQNKRSSESGASSTTWIILAFSAIILAAIAFFIWQRMKDNVQFVLVAGDPEVLVLLRDDEEVVYTLQYNGSRPVDLEKLLVKLGPGTLHVDVNEVVLVRGDGQVVLERASTVPDGTEFTLEPGDVFDVVITMRGKSIGGNWFYGFRIDYDARGRTGTFELDLDEEYAIIIK